MMSPEARAERSSVGAYETAFQSTHDHRLATTASTERCDFCEEKFGLFFLVVQIDGRFKCLSCETLGLFNE